MKYSELKLIRPEIMNKKIKDLLATEGALVIQRKNKRLMKTYKDKGINGALTTKL